MNKTFNFSQFLDTNNFFELNQFLMNLRKKENEEYFRKLDKKNKNKKRHFRGQEKIHAPGNMR